MALLETRNTDLQELYQLLELYNRTYGGEATGGLVQEVKDRCTERGIRPDAGNSRGAGRKKKFTAETDQKIIDLSETGNSIR